MNRLTVNVILIIFFFTSNVYSQNEEIQQIKLTSSDVKTFIQSFPGIVEEFQKLDIKYNAEDYEFSVAESTEVVNKVNSIVKKHGYKDYVDFYSKVAAIGMTYASIKMQEENVNIQPEIEKAIREIESSNQYTAEQKEQMISMIKQGSQAMSTISNDESVKENVAVVSPFANEIEAVFDEVE